MLVCMRPLSSFRPFGCALLLSAAILAGEGCALFRSSSSALPEGIAPTALPAERIHAVLINGGGRRAQNYLSHRMHLDRALALLREAHVPESQISVFASDGPSRAPDLATRRPASETGERLLGGTAFYNRLVGPIDFINTTLPEVTLQPATPAALDRWMATEGQKLIPGDILFLYVTDHGTRGKAGPRQNAITMWGKDSALTVDQLDVWLKKLPKGVRVVAFMSQCFSGGFARLAAADEALPDGRMCGYFASTETRPAYGCYPEARGGADIGHSVRMFEAVETRGWLAEGHRHAVVTDFTPDVPIRTSDVQLELALKREAVLEGLPFEELSDVLLDEAFAEPGQYEPEIRQLDRISAAFGFAGARSLTEVDQRLLQIEKIATPLTEWSQAWTAAHHDLTRANLSRFLDARPTWRDRLGPRELDTLDVNGRAALGDDLIADLGPWTARSPATGERLELLVERSEVSDALAYRMEVREAALERLRAQLIRLAGLRWLDTRADTSQKAAFLALFECEDLVLPLKETGALPPAPENLASWDDDLDLARSVLPAWMGIQFEPAKIALRNKYNLTEGAVLVRWVYPGSPAAKAGLVPGDVIIGPPGAAFAEPAQIREWVMLRQIGREVELIVLRDGAQIRTRLVPAEHPGRYPDLPRAPRKGTPAPALQVDAQRGTIPKDFADGRRRILFFWATWCAPCKAALPDLLDWAADHDAEIIAITDEPAEPVTAFLKSWKDAFPEVVARDRGRATFLRYGVSGTPNFVLIGGDGRIEAIRTGYNAGKGLRLPD